MLRLVAGIVLITGFMRAANDAYTTSVKQWRQEREARLKSDTGWLTITGLIWLEDGSNHAGSAESNRIRLPKPVPARLGEIERRGGQVSLRYANPAKGTVVLKPDLTGEPTVIKIGAVQFWLIQRGDRFGIRVRDQNSKFRRRFTGCRWYPVKPEYRVIGKLVRQPRKIRIPSVIGVTEEFETPGYVEFQLHGQRLRLLPTEAAGDSIEFVLRDGTSGKTTYGASRFLDTKIEKDGTVVLDFNKAYNPPCAFIPYATCPLPPRENRLRIPIEAGEKTYPHQW